MTIYSEKEYTPYTYLIGWTDHNLWYYGTETGKKTKTANPDNLWETYFTSSGLVTEFRKTLGEPDIIQVRKTFNTAEEAILWEHKVLRRLKVNKSPKWINNSLGGPKLSTTDMVIITDGEIQFMIHKDSIIPEGFRPGVSDKSRENIKAASRKRKWHFPESAHKKSKESRKNTILINNGETQKRYPKDKPLPEGYVKGALPEICEAASARLMGHKHSEETKERIRIKRISKRYYTNGVIEICIETNPPEGFFPGRAPRTESHNINSREARKGLRWYTNGEIDRQFKPENVPEGFLPGRCLTFVRSKEAIELSRQSAIGKKWYTDGVKNIRGTECPVGFKPGKTHRPK